MAPAVEPVGSERRQQPRIAWGGGARAALGARRVQCHASNLSKTGICVGGSWRAYPGQRVELSFELEGRAVHVMGVVTWARTEQQAQWGVQFTVVHPKHQKRIDAFVDRSLQTRRPVGLPPGLGRFDLPDESAREQPTLTDRATETQASFVPGPPALSDDIFADEHPTALFDPHLGDRS